MLIYKSKELADLLDMGISTFRNMAKGLCEIKKEKRLDGGYALYYYFKNEQELEKFLEKIQKKRRPFRKDFPKDRAISFQEFLSWSGYNTIKDVLNQLKTLGFKFEIIRDPENQVKYIVFPDIKTKKEAMCKITILDKDEFCPITLKKKIPERIWRKILNQT